MSQNKSNALILILAIGAIVTIMSLSGCILSKSYREKRENQYIDTHPLTEKQKQYLRNSK